MEELALASANMEIALWSVFGTGRTANATATTTIGTSVSKTVIGTQFNLTATTVNTLFGSNSQLRAIAEVYATEDSKSKLEIVSKNVIKNKENIIMKKQN